MGPCGIETCSSEDFFFVLYVLFVAKLSLWSSKIVKNATLKVYPGFPHGMCSTHKDVINADLLAFLKGEKAAAA